MINPQSKSCFGGLLIHQFYMKTPFRIIVIMASLATMSLSCANDMEVLKKIIDPEEEPDVTVINAELFYSDSARLQAKIITPVVKKYESAKNARDEFPQGLHVWLYEKTGELKAEITANWANRDITTELWEARSNVVLINVEGQKLETEQLFWDQKKGEVYSQKYTKLTKDGSYEGAGDSFWAKQDFSEYKFFNKSGAAKAVLYMKDDETENEMNKP